MKFIFTLAISIFTLTNIFAINPPADKDPGKTLAAFADLLVGRYSNSTQYTSNPEDYFHLSISVCSIWEDDDQVSGKWFYIEHAMYSMGKSPIRQFVWNVTQIDENTVSVVIFELPEKKRFANSCRGSWDNDAFDNMVVRDLIPHEGCEIILNRQVDGSFEGRMGGYDCETEEGAATSLRSEIKITKREILLKDQGFNDDGDQVWGPKDHQPPYVFKKVR